MGLHSISITIILFVTWFFPKTPCSNSSNCFIYNKTILTAAEAQHLAK